MTTKTMGTTETLGMAINFGANTLYLYQVLVEGSRNPLLSDRFKNMHNETEEYLHFLKKLYHNILPYMETEDTQTPPSVEVYNLSFMETIKIAINEEKGAHEFFLDCSKSTSDKSCKKLYHFLADVSSSHYEILNSQIEILEKYPEYKNDALKLPFMIEINNDESFCRNPH